MLILCKFVLWSEQLTLSQTGSYITPYIGQLSMQYIAALFFITLFTQSLNSENMYVYICTVALSLFRDFFIY